MASSHQHESYRKVNLQFLGGEAFQATNEWSNREALWGELFKEKERASMRKHLVSRMVAFSIKDTYQISVRMLLTKDALQPHDPAMGSADNALKGQVALVLHDFKGQLTSSWAWAKFVYPLHKANVSVVMVDWPGFGVSKICNQTTAPLERWEEKDWRIITQLLDSLQIRRAHMITYGASCNAIMKMLRYVKLRLETTHICLNPTVDLEQIFPLPLRPGLSPEEIDQLKQDQRHQFELMMHNSRIKLWAIFDQTCVDRTADTSNLFHGFASLPFASDQITLTRLTENHVCVAAAGSMVPVQVLFPCRWLKSGFVRHIMNDPEFHPPKSLVPGEEEEGSDQWAYSTGGLGATNSSLAGGLGATNSSLATAGHGGQVAMNAWTEVRAASAGAVIAGQDTRATSASWQGREISGAQGALALPRSAGAVGNATMGGALTSWGSLFAGSGPGERTLAASTSAPSLPRPQSQSQPHRASASWRPTENVLKLTAKTFGCSPLEMDDGCRPRPARMDKAMALACELQLRGVKNEREALLSNTKTVTKLRNAAERRAATLDQRLPADLHSEERAWLEDAIEFSMHTLDTDDKRRADKAGRVDGAKIWEEMGMKRRAKSSMKRRNQRHEQRQPL